MVSEMRRAYDGFGRGDMDAVLSVMAPGVEWDASDALAHTGVYHAHEGVREYVEGISSVWENFELDAEEITEAGAGNLMVLGTIRGRLKASGEQVEARFAHVLRVEDDKVIRLKVCLDRDGARRALQAAADEPG